MHPKVASARLLHFEYKTDSFFCAISYDQSGPGAANNTNNSTKKGSNNKNTKQQPKRQGAQSIDLDRENQQRKPNTGGTTNKPASTQSRPLLSQNKPTPSGHQIANMSQTQQSDQRKVQSAPNNIRSQQTKQQSSQERTGERVSDRRETSLKPISSHAKRSLVETQENSRQDEAAVTFADHIRVNDDDDVGQRYTFGFFEEQRQQTNQVKPGKLTPKHNEKLVMINSKTSQVGQKHKMKHPKASLNSEQKRYKCNDDIDANSFNYHQILEFISNCKYSFLNWVVDTLVWLL